MGIARTLLVTLALAACTSHHDFKSGIDAGMPPAVDAPADGCATATWYEDCDGDGVAALGGATMVACAQPTTSSCNGTWITTMPTAGTADCNDLRADVHPGAVEVCDLLDNDCDGPIDEDGLTTFYRDADGDGHGTSAMTMTTCTAPAGYVTTSDDCNDARADVYPGHAEVCDGADNNCNLVTDEGVQITYYRDADGDGHGNAAVTTQACSVPAGYVTSTDDCNDARNDIYPGHAEVCDTVDNNCNNQTDEGVQNTYYRDADGDGYGNPQSTTMACSAPATYVSNSTDCNDGASSVNPGAQELCFNATDDNCSGTQDEAAECSMDCNWSGARWLSHGYDGGAAASTGAWATCMNNKLSYLYFVNGGTAVNPTAGGTGTGYVDCNWGNASRWISQGWDGGNAFSFGADVRCNGTRVTMMTWENNQLMTGQVPIAMAGQLGCNWTGAIFLAHGIDGTCAPFAGMIVTCSNSHITEMRFTEAGSCVRQRD